MNTMSHATHNRYLACLAGLAALATACNGDDAQDSASSGFTDSQGSNTNGDGPGEYLTSGGDGGEPPPPGDGAELCDAGDEAWVKRVIPLLHGRRPESIREVRVLVQMVEQLEALGVDGRATVAMGLARGPEYQQRWKQWIYEQLRINVSSDRRNELCYDVRGPEADSPNLAEFIRDNPVASNYGNAFRMADVVYSSLLLDDLSPAYRADNFARHSAPVIAGNVCADQLEDLSRAAYGKIFESAYLGRFTECMDCHRTEFSVTDSTDTELDRHWPLPGNSELAVYGPDAALPDAARSHAIFRRHGFSATPWLTPGVIPGCDAVTDDAPSGDDLAWGMDEQCGMFLFGADGETEILSQVPVMVGTYEDVSPPDGVGATIVTLDERMRAGLDAYYNDGLGYAGDGTLDDYQTGFARLYSMNIANRVWTEAMGYPLTVANNFPRNEAQQQTLLSLTDSFATQRYSLRNLLVAVTTHDYFNQDTPDACDASVPYHMAAIFEPFTKASTDPVARGNGVGDSVHRYSAMVLLDSLAQSMWWNRAQRFGPSMTPDQLPGSPLEGGCGTGGYPPCVEEPSNVEFLRDVGVFLNDSESGFNGVDFNGLLHWESRTAQGGRIDFGGDCTGPLGGACPEQDWITQMVAVATASSGATLRDVAVAVKDRLITEPTIANSGEVAAIELIMGAQLDTPISSVPADQIEAAARRFAGLLLNTPQFLLAGVPSEDQDPGDDPVLVVGGTSTQELCQYLGNLVLAGDFAWSCGADGITISG
ncbi:MAG: hypothetical protein IAG13_23330 [Deltaproteobacteria bacterium]|nr:hypothetical protein [Nannocystaceae bacterium]